MPPDAVEIATARVFERAHQRLARAPLPAATYRVQIHAGFPFERVAGIVPYLHELGATDLYASPYLRAAPGSTHGYDVTGHNEINPELGGTQGLAVMSDTLRAHGMSHLLDFVPNHMGIGPGNTWWLDVLENGPSSMYARFFDVDWNPVKDELENKVLLPILGGQYGAVLEAGELQLELSSGTLWLRYWDARLPVNPRQYSLVLRHRIDELQARVPAQDLALQELLSICTACDNLPHRTETDPARIEERHREKEVIKRRLDALVSTSAEVRAHVEQALREFNGVPGQPRSFDELDRLLDAQAYRLAHWAVAGEEINYRRFFDINSLAAIRMEDPVVFREAHRLVFELLERGVMRGMRIDHPDGLFEPRNYFRRLQEEYFVGVCRSEHRQLASDVPFEEIEPLVRGHFALDAQGPGSPLFRPLYVLAEKILGRGERIPATWAIHGTTGYEYLNAVNGLFVDPSSEKAITDTYARFTGLRHELPQLIYEKKKLVMSWSMASELNVLARQLNRISEMNRRSRDFTLNSLRAALIEYVASFPVYRTYVSESGVDDRDRGYVEAAIARAKRRASITNPSIFDFLRDVLLVRSGTYCAEETLPLQLAFAMKLQQLTGPVMAKALEDTSFYIFNRLVSLNEVGGEPDHFGTPVEAFHADNRARLESFPGSLLTTSTHDTKRSEDVRARIDVISELHEEWRGLVSRLGRLARRHKLRISEEQLAPDRNEEYLLYQTLLGVWPDGEASAPPELVERVTAYLLKAAREAKVNTSWVNPDPTWDEALQSFVRAVMTDPAFLAELLPFARRVAEAGMVNSLAQLVLKIASPGVTDVYQGTELWDLSLVDPDNRRPVDFELRSSVLRALSERVGSTPDRREELCRELWEARHDGRVKLYVTWRGLRARRNQPDLFLAGTYLPLEARGARAGNLVALARRRGGAQAVAVVPRLTARMEPGPSGWAGTDVLLPEGTDASPLVDVFTGAVHVPVVRDGRACLEASRLFAALPVALLQPSA